MRQRSRRKEKKSKRGWELYFDGWLRLKKGESFSRLEKGEKNQKRLQIKRRDKTDISAANRIRWLERGRIFSRSRSTSPEKRRTSPGFLLEKKFREGEVSLEARKSNLKRNERILKNKKSKEETLISQWNRTARLLGLVF